jgi:hypothetical protein
MRIFAALNPYRYLRRKDATLRRKAYRILFSYKCLYTEARNPGLVVHDVHILVVKNPKYAPLAKICLESFLFYNPHSIATVHCDLATLVPVERSLKKLIKRGQVIVSADLTRENLSWQELKLNLITGLCGSNSVFMDADLRWNGLLRELNQITFFVKEFEFKSHQYYQTFLSHALFDRHSFGSMKNTSFFTWSGKDIHKDALSKILEVYRSLLKAAKDFISEPVDQYGMERISEQLAISIVSEWWGYKIDYLKEIDVFRDGKFVESSYFGTTGSEF